MRTLHMICASLLCAAPAYAQVSVSVTAPPPPRVVVAAPPPPRVVVAPPAPPTVRFVAPPPMVEVRPGVRVVRDCDEEVFYSGGFYWHAGPEGHWYRTRSYRGGWVMAPRHAVPVAIVRMPHGRYRHYHGEGRMERRAERRWEHRHGRRG